jgi:uncharacterized membrane protein YozB (DUF420 family)
LKVEDFPIIDATLNGTSAVLLAIGYILIRMKKWRAHATVMIAALTSSTAFLTCYLIYHYFIGVTKFPDIPQVKEIYYTILATHVFLAFVILPLIAITVFRASKRRWARHMAMGRITLPLWFYVSVTGVVIYWMLYSLAPRLMAWHRGQ